MTSGSSHGKGRRLRSVIEAVIEPGRESGYVARCQGIGIVTQGSTLDETVANLREATALFLEDEDLARHGLTSSPRLLVTLEVDLVRGARSSRRRISR